jgi:hypothetical protein
LAVYVHGQIGNIIIKKIGGWLAAAFFWKLIIRPFRRNTAENIMIYFIGLIELKER